MVLDTRSPTTATGSLFLSRLRLNSRHPVIQQSLGEPQRLHTLVMALLPDAGLQAARSAFDVLHRVDLPDDADFAAGRGASGPLLMVQAGLAPVLSPKRWSDDMLIHNPWDETGPLATRDVAPIFTRIVTGQRLGFRLRANPTKRLSLTRPDDPASADQGPDRLLSRHREDGKGTGPRVALLKPAEQVGWLVRQGERHGFALVPQDRTWAVTEGPDEPAFVLTTASVQTGGSRGRQRDRLTHNAVTFDGELTVTDADAFRAALRTGIGPAKAYGFGLLSVRSPR